MVFKNGVKNIQAACYTGACTVYQKENSCKIFRKNSLYKSTNAPSESISTHDLPRLRKCQYLQKFCKLVEVCQPPFALFAIGVCNYGQTQRRLNSHTKYNAVIVYCLKRIMNFAVCTTLSQILQFLMSSFLILITFFLVI